MIGEQRLGECSAKFAVPSCHAGGPVRWFVAGTGNDAISHFHSPNRCSQIITHPAQDPVSQEELFITDVPRPVVLMRLNKVIQDIKFLGP